MLSRQLLTSDNDNEKGENDVKEANMLRAIN